VIQVAERPVPIVKVPKLIKYGGVPPREYKVGKGFSIGEIKALGLSIREARLLGIYVDERRRSVHEENIKRLREYLRRVLEGAKPAEPTLPKVEKLKPQRRRVFRGLTPAGRRMRGLVTTRLKETHRYKWKRKQKERLLRKRHEASRGARPPFF